jgi:hypothetical protein
LKGKLLQKITDKVVLLDSFIRFAAIVDGEGKILATSERKGLKPLLNLEERAQYAITAATRQYTRLRWEYLLGKIVYACSRYKKLIRATIPITNENSTLTYVLLLSFDAEAKNAHKIIMEKIIPILEKNKHLLSKK